MILYSAALLPECTHTKLQFLKKKSVLQELRHSSASKQEHYSYSVVYKRGHHFYGSTHGSLNLSLGNLFFIYLYHRLIECVPTPIGKMDRILLPCRVHVLIVSKRSVLSLVIVGRIVHFSSVDTPKAGMTVESSSKKDSACQKGVAAAADATVVENICMPLELSSSWREMCHPVQM